MRSMALPAEFMRRGITNALVYNYKSEEHPRAECKEHEECGETAMYPMSPIQLSLYYAFNFEAGLD